MWLSCLLLWPTLTTPLRLSGPAFVSVKMQYHCNSTSINSNFRLIAEYSQLFQWVADHMGPAEFLPSTWFLNLMADYGCGDHARDLFCFVISSCVYQVGNCMHPRFKISMTHLGILGFGDSMREYSLLVLWVRKYTTRTM